jgi:hypothetical protein
MKAEFKTVCFPLAALVLASLTATPAGLFAQPPQGTGSQSRPGQAQPGQPLSEDASGPRMPGGEPGRGRIEAPQDTLIGGKRLKMEEVLRARPQPVSGEQPSLEAAKALKPSGGGGQIGRRAGRNEAGSHLQLVLRVTESGESEVVSAAEIPGPAPLNAEPLGVYAYEITEGDRTVAVQALPDPFELRAFSPPDTAKGHHIERAKVATITVDVPLSRADAAMDRVGVNLIKLEPGREVQKVDITELVRLKQENRVRVLSTLPASKLAPQMRQKVVPLEKVVEPPQ